MFYYTWGSYSKIPLKFHIYHPTHRTGQPALSARKAKNKVQCRECELTENQMIKTDDFCLRTYFFSRLYELITIRNCYLLWGFKEIIISGIKFFFSPEIGIKIFIHENLVSNIWSLVVRYFKFFEFWMRQIW